MQVSTRRRLDRVLLVVVALIVGAVAAVGALSGDSERIAYTEVHVAVQPDGSARVAEVIDYDFGTASDRHGIFRDVPGLTEASDVQVSSDAPDQFVLLGDRIKIGDPDETIAGRHRYEIGYTLDDVAPDGLVAFNGVGAGWDVPITRAVVVVAGPWQWSGLRCDRGTTGATGGCEVRQVEPGRLVVDVEGLDAHEGVTIYADDARALSAAPELPTFAAPPADDSPGVAVPFALAVVAALIGGLVVSVAARRAGAELVGGGDAADAAFVSAPPAGGGAPSDPPPGVRRIDHDELAELSTIEFAPPPGLSAACGGVVLRESVQPEHQVAWLIELVAAGLLALDEGTGTRWLRRTDAPDRPLPAVVAKAFAGRPQIELGTYDPAFAEAWTQIDVDLRMWMGRSGLWDPAGDRRRTSVLVGGSLAAALGTVAVFLMAAMGSLPLVAVAALVAGAGALGVLTAWELRVRSVVGSALWLRVESFRRFLAESEAQHVDWAVQHGLLRQYTAWAVAVGEIDHWNQAVGASTMAASMDPGATHLSLLAPSLVSDTGSTATAPSSSGSGGGGGVGGGSGGGGGGSW